MGLLTDALRVAIPERKVAVGTMVPTWQSGTPQYATQTAPYARAAREAYGWNEVVYACVEELATSAAEPCIAAYRKTADKPEKIPEHPVLDLLERPNPFMTRFGLTAGIILYLSIAGNAYVELVRSKSGGVVELWLLRPDRMRVIPDRERFIRGYRYELGDVTADLDVRDVIHIKTRHPWDDFYGMPPLAACAPRIDTANMMRSFTAAFFQNAGVPAGMLKVQKTLNESERERIQQRFRGEYGGVQGFHNLLIMDAIEAEYVPMGLPLGERGLVMPDLDDINTAHIATVFGVPLELIGAKLSMRGQRSAAQEARRGFWDETLAPLYVQLGEALSNGLVDEFTGVDYLEYDMSTVKALAEDQDAKHARVREDMLAGLITREEARNEIGFEPEPPPDATWILGRGLTEVPPGEVGPAPNPPAAPPSDLAAAAAGAGAGAAAEPPPTDGKLGQVVPIQLTPADLHRAMAWMATMPGLERALALHGKRNGKH